MASVFGLRFVGAFGKREIEEAAIRIYDSGKLRGPIRAEDVAGGDAQAGFRLLVELKWLLPSASVPGSYFATKTFIDRVLGAVERDRTEGVTL